MTPEEIGWTWNEEEKTYFDASHGLELSMISEFETLTDYIPEKDDWKEIQFSCPTMRAYGEAAPYDIPLVVLEDFIRRYKETL